jgi:hypothetical protein
VLHFVWFKRNILAAVTWLCVLLRLRLRLRLLAVCDLQDQLQPLGASEAGRQHIILVRTNISLLAATNSSSNSSSKDNGTVHTIPKGGVAVPYPVTLLSDVSPHGGTELDLGFRRGLLALEANAEDGQLQVRAWNGWFIHDNIDSAAALNVLQVVKPLSAKRCCHCPDSLVALQNCLCV